MDQQQHHLGEDSANLGPPAFGFYSNDQDPSYGLAYNSQMAPYHHQVVHPGPQTRQLSVTDLHQQGLHGYPLGLVSPHQYPGPVYTSSSPHVNSMPLSASPPPPSPDMYDHPLSPPVSGSDTSADGIYHHSNSSGTGSPSSSRGNSLVHRHHPIRYNPTPSPTSSSGRRGRGRSHDSDEEDLNMNENMTFRENLANSRKEATRRQRIEAEQRRRDELRDGYAKLKDVLPLSNQKSSKVSLLERATNHILDLEKDNEKLQARITELQQEMARLRAVNEKISLGSNDAEGEMQTPSPGMFDARPLSPPPDGPPPHPNHSLASVRGQRPPSEDSSPSASEGGF